MNWIDETTRQPRNARRGGAIANWSRPGRRHAAPLHVEKFICPDSNERLSIAGNRVLSRDAIPVGAAGYDKHRKFEQTENSSKLKTEQAQVTDGD